MQPTAGNSNRKRKTGRGRHGANSSESSKMAADNGATSTADATADMVIDDVVDDSENMPRKMEHDYSAEVTVALKESDKIVAEGRLEDAIASLIPLEKQARLATDVKSTARILYSIVSYCWDHKNFDALNENIINLSKRRGQLKGAIRKMVQQCMNFVKEVDDQAKKLELIETLRTVTAGKIFVEVERARLTKTLAEIKEKDGNKEEAASVLQDLQVETFGSMEKKEKVDFILEQMRLCLETGDHVRTAIISKKVTSKYFTGDDVQEQKAKYYQLLIDLGVAEGRHLDVCRYLTHLYNTQIIRDDQTKAHDCLMNASVYAVLAPYDAEQHEQIRLVAKIEQIKELPVCDKLLACFITNELLDTEDLVTSFSTKLSDMTVFTGDGQKNWDVLKSRIVEHNIRIIAKYYTKITTTRFAELLGISEADAEENLSRLVVSKTIFARIDRPAGIVSFRREAAPAELLNAWSSDVNKLMKLVDTTMHMINKENMVHVNK